MPCILSEASCKSATKMKSHQSLVCCDIMTISSLLSGRRLSNRSCHRGTLSCQERSETKFHHQCQPLSIMHCDFFINTLRAVCTLSKCHRHNDASSRINLSVYQMRLHRLHYAPDYPLERVSDGSVGDPIISSD